jgi:hypothetical protein
MGKIKMPLFDQILLKNNIFVSKIVGFCKFMCNSSYMNQHVLNGHTCNQSLTHDVHFGCMAECHTPLGYVCTTGG